MFSNPLVRLLIGGPLAVIVTYGLFLAMNTAISRDYEQPEVEDQRTLEAITPAEEDRDVQRRSRSKAKRIQDASQPPPPPKLSTSKQQIDLPTPNIQGVAPTEVKFDRLQNLAVNPVSISDRDAQPIRPPLPSYPNRAAERGIEGSCDVRFDVNPRGQPFNIQADCTDDIFKREAERAVSKVEFAPKIVRGQAVGRSNVVYPLEFKLSN